MKYYFKCPRCGRDDGFTLPAEQSSGLGCLLLLFGGVIPALLYSDAQSHRVQCDSCGYIFRQPALPKTGVAKLATAILLVYIVAVIAALFLVCSPETADLLPRPRFVQDIVLVLSGHTEAFMLLVGATAVATLCLCFLASATSSIAQRRRLSKECELRPKRKSMTRDRQQSPRASSSKAADGLTGNAQE